MNRRARRNRQGVIETIQGMLFIVTFIAMLGIGGYIETHYTRVATVTDRYNDEVVCVDKFGYEWSFFVDEEDTLKKNDTIKLIMYTHHTDNTILDDEIENYKFIR